MANFYEEVLAKDPRFRLATRCSDDGLLEPRTRQLAHRVLEVAAERGISVMLYETFRSSARQLLLYEKGVTRRRDDGVHKYGLAFDVVRSVWGEPSWKGDYAFLGEIAKELGLVWGGDWGSPERRHSFVDAYHLQRVSVADQARLFRGEFYPGEDYDPFRK